MPSGQTAHEDVQRALVSVSRQRPSLGKRHRRLAKRSNPADASPPPCFFPSELAGCYKCHRCEGRGADVGPDLSTIAARAAHIVESILQRAPGGAHFQRGCGDEDGKVKTGMLLHTHLDE